MTGIWYGHYSHYSLPGTTLTATSCDSTGPENEIKKDLTHFQL